MTIFGEKIFTNPIKIIKAFNHNEIKEAFATIEELKNKFYLVGYIRYDIFKEQINNKFPLLYFEVYTTYNIYKTKKV